MMIFLESPWPILLIGIAVEAVLAVMLLRTRAGPNALGHARHGRRGVGGPGGRALRRHRPEGGRKHARCVRGGG